MVQIYVRCMLSTEMCIHEHMRDIPLDPPLFICNLFTQSVRKCLHW